MFHPPRNPNDAVNGLGYISDDGHLFECNNPAVMQQEFHVYGFSFYSVPLSLTLRQT